MSDDEVPVTAKSLIKGYEKGEAFKPGEVKSSEKPEINEPVAKSLISSFESGKVYATGELATEKPDIHEPLAKNLISSFEKGGVKGTADVKTEKPMSRPGATRNLQKVYESIDKDSKIDAAPLSPGRAEQQNVSKNAGPMTSLAATNVNDADVKEQPAMSTGKKKTVLLVYAHWKKSSFNGALFDVTERTLTELGYNVIVSDLYAMDWDPVVSFRDLGDKKVSEDTNYLTEIKAAVADGTIAKDIAAEQEKVNAADLVIFQFPLSWLSYPAILKGWMDRVLCNGFAFITEKGRLFDNGLLKGKKALLSMTTGGTESVYGNSGVNGDIEVVLWPMHYGALRFSGFDVLPPNICYAVTLTGDEQRKKYLASWQQRLRTIFDEAPLNFVPLSEFDLQKGLTLSEDSPLLKSSPKDIGLSVGQNLGRAFPRGSMTGENTD